MRAIIPAANGAAAEVPVCLSVQPVPVPRRQSVVTWGKNKVELNVYSKIRLTRYRKSNGTDLSTESFSGENEYPQRHSSFLGFPGMIGKSCSICFVPLVPCSLKKEKP